MFFFLVFTVPVYWAIDWRGTNVTSSSLNLRLSTTTTTTTERFSKTSMYYLREILRLFHLLLSIPLTLGQQLHVENGPSSPSSSTAAAATTTTPFNISALVSRDGYSVIECWQLAASSTYALFALNWILGNTTHVKLTMAEPGEISTDAWAPAVQYVRIPLILNSGLFRLLSELLSSRARACFAWYIRLHV